MKSHDHIIWPSLIPGVFASYAFVSMHYSTDFIEPLLWPCTMINTIYSIVNKTDKVSALTELIIW